MKTRTVLLVLVLGIFGASCSGGDEGGKAITTKPANFKGAEAGETSPGAQQEAGPTQSAPPPGG